MKISIAQKLTRKLEAGGYQPIEDKDMHLRHETHPFICSILRDIYHATDNEAVRCKARLACAIARDMYRHLMKHREEE